MKLVIESAIVLVLLASIVLPKLRVCRVNEYFEDYLSLESTKSLRGLMAVLIVLHHLSAYYTEFTFLSPFQHIGYIIVAVFFFLSGYGLFYGFEKKANYLNGFLGKRLPSIILPYYLAILLYALVYWILNINFSTKEMLLSFIGIRFFVPGSWYIVMQVIMYVIFFAAFSLMKNKSFKLQMTFFFVLFVIVFVAFLFSDSDLFTRSIFAFPLGILWCKYKNKIENILNNRYIICIIFIAVIQVVTFGLKFVGESISVKEMSFIGSVLSSAVFPIFVMIIFMKFRVRNRILDFLGDISLEIYLLHNIALRALSKLHFVVNNPLIYVVLAFATVIALSYLFKKLNGVIVPKTVKLLTR